MKVHRRGFFASLLAPVIARFAPKPKMLTPETFVYNLDGVTIKALDDAYNQAWAGSCHAKTIWIGYGGVPRQSTN